MGKLLIVGTLAFDTIETPFGKTEKIMGGAANYISIAASQFEVEMAIVSVIGDDYPQEYIDILSDRNIDVTGIECIKGEKTFFWSGRYHNDMNTRSTVDTQLNALKQFCPRVPQSYKKSEILMLGNLHPRIQLEVLEQMQTKPNLVVLDTMNYWIDNSRDELLEVIKKCNVITINDEEARQLTGEYSIVKAAHKIIEMGVPFVIVKKGQHGALLFHQKSVFYAPALPLEEDFDPTGAGDTFAGGFVGYLTKTKNFSFNNMKNAVVYGANLASFCVEKFGLERMLSLTKDEVSKRLVQFKELTQFEIKIA